jgi:molybdopterin converting factor small subunit
MSAALSILFFGAVGERAGRKRMDLATPPDVDTIDALIGWLAHSDEALRAALSAPGLRVAIDQAFAAPNASVRGAREIAFMSPLSGG